MYLTEVFFKYQKQKSNPPRNGYFVNQIIEQWRYNGQILGREIPLFYAEQGQEKGFAVRVICPEEYSLLADFNNEMVEIALANATKQGIVLDSFQIVADDLNSDSTYQGEKPHWQLLYTTFLQSCSPLHSGDNFAPIPLYKQLKNIPYLSMDIIKWQENWQACDQLQMNGSTLELQALNEISNTTSQLFKHGYHLCQSIEQHTGIPTYYYLYRVGGESKSAEQQRCCPMCHQPWHLAEPYFDVIHFKCDVCRLVSNISWNWL